MPMTSKRMAAPAWAGCVRMKSSAVLRRRRCLSPVTVATGLDFIRFSELPWITRPQHFRTVHQQLLRAWPDGARQRNRFIALGFDALNILPYLDRLRDAAGDTLLGATGALSADASGILHRQPDWARFDQGRAVALNHRPGNDAPSNTQAAQRPITTVVVNAGS